MGVKLRINGIIEESIVDGEGIRFVVFTQGCKHNCPGCHNPSTHPVDGGERVDIESILKQALENPLLDGVTFSGGEPFLQAGPLSELAKGIKKAGLNITAYTGYTYERLLQIAKDNDDIASLLSLTDTLIDGPYVEELRDLSLAFRGSKNQRIIDLSDKNKQQQTN